MTIVFIHGFTETKDIWNPLRAILGRESIAVALPGFDTTIPQGFIGTKDAYVEWLVEFLKSVKPPIDLVGHDVGALITMRLISFFDIPVRSWVADVGPIFHPENEWPERVQKLQTPTVGEEMQKVRREASPKDPKSTTYILQQIGVPKELALKIGKAHNETMSKCILDFYRSAIPNVAKDWWRYIKPDIKSHGLILLLPDPPEEEKKSLEVAAKLHAETARLDNLNHCWMAEAPEIVAQVLENFWSSLE